MEKPLTRTFWLFFYGPTSKMEELKHACEQPKWMPGTEQNHSSVWTRSRADSNQYRCLSPDGNEVQPARYCTTDSSKPAEFFLGTLYVPDNVYLYHGSIALFEPPFVVQSYANSLTPVLGWAAYYATRAQGEGYVYEYSVPRGAIPNMLFACGSFSQLQAEQWIRNYLHAQGEDFDAILASEGLEQRKTLYTAISSDPYLALVCASKRPLAGISLLNYERQIRLCRSAAEDYLETHRVWHALRSRVSGAIYLQQYPPKTSQVWRLKPGEKDPVAGHWETVPRIPETSQWDLGRLDEAFRLETELEPAPPAPVSPLVKPFSRKRTRSPSLVESKASKRLRSEEN